MRELLIATKNKGKIPEIAHSMEGLPITCVSLADVPSIGADEDVEETGMTFEGNALIKAFTWGMKTGMLTLADDSGLEIDALDGRPGVYSSRYAPGSDIDRYQKVLEEMKDVPDEARTARYRSVAALFDLETMRVRTCTGTWEVVIEQEPKGENGFGYDPITRCVKHERTSAQMTMEEKSAVSHRGMAMRKAREILEKEFLK